VVGYSRAVKVGDRVLVAGTAPIWPDGSVNLVRTRIYITDRDYAETVGKAHGAVFGEVRPASSMVVVSALLDPRWKVEIEAEAIVT
jgi:enamine deaminase RidA (YjgF/YER057c/UK114 family)